ARQGAARTRLRQQGRSARRRDRKRDARGEPGGRFPRRSSGRDLQRRNNQWKVISSVHPTPTGACPMHAKKVALITGANKGIGFEIVRQLARQGLTVVLGARDRERGEKAAGQLRDEGLDVQFVRLDVTDAPSVAALPDFFAERFGRLDVLVNNAGMLIDKGIPPSQLDEAKLRQTLDRNFLSVFVVSKS